MPTSWLVVHLASVACLTGVGWLVQVVVYPAFRLVGPGEWAIYHRRHSRGMACVVVLPWAAQGVSVVALVLAVPSVPTVLLVALAAATVLVTMAGAVPVHTRIRTLVSERDVTVLLRFNLVRTLAWTASSATTGTLLVAEAAG